MRIKLAVAAAVLAALPWFLHEYGLQVAIQAVVLAVFAMSFNLLFRNTGLLSFGHAACFGAAGYTTALLVSKLGWNFPATLPLALLAAALVSLVIGFLSVRLTKIYFTMLTLAFAQMLWAVAHKWYGFTGGDNGITGLLPPGLLGSPKGLYYASLVSLALVSAIIHMVRRSPAGYTLRAVRDNPARAEAIGISAFEYMVAAFVLSGTLSGLAGFLQVAWQHSAFPDLFYWTTSAEVIIAVILGGSAEFFGPVVGAVVLVVLEALVRSHTQYWPLALGIVLLAMVLFFPSGVIGLFQRRRREEASRAAA
jgi:branched-chain amino acid transport system permease protein